jgi:hypothetical protein
MKMEKHDWLVKQEAIIAGGGEYVCFLPLDNLGKFQRDVLDALDDIQDRLGALMLKVQILGERSLEPEGSDPLGDRA